MNLRDGLIALTIVGLAIGVFFLNNPTSAPTTQNENPSVVQKNEIRAEEGYMAPDFKLTTLDGKSASLSQYKGKPTVITFWTTWCSYCRKEMPSMQKAYENYGKRVNFLMINVTSQDKEKTVGDYIKENEFTFPVLLDKEGKGSKDYGIRGFPTTFIISKEGTVQLKKVGALEAEGLNAAIDKVLKEK